jgi:hypothetical protein
MYIMYTVETYVDSVPGIEKLKRSGETEVEQSLARSIMIVHSCQYYVIPSTACI